MATCWKPHTAHNAIISRMAVASGARRKGRAVVLMDYCGFTDSLSESLPHFAIDGVRLSFVLALH
jgi:hypothetical protein